MRHGYGVRYSAPFGLASSNKLSDIRMNSLSSLDQEADKDSGNEALAFPAIPASKQQRSEDPRGGFVLVAKGDTPNRRRSLVERTGMRTFMKGLKLKKQRSTGDINRKGVTSIRSNESSTSWMSLESGYNGGASVVSEGSFHSFVMGDEQLDASITEMYMGEWKNDKRTGFGISERSDGLKYEGEWYNNCKYGYGVTTFMGSVEEGKYKNNVLITSSQKRHLFLMRSAKFRERIDSAINAAQRASKIAMQKADIAISRTATARGKAEQSDIASMQAREDSQAAKRCARKYGTIESKPHSPYAKDDMKKNYLRPDVAAHQHRVNTPESALAACSTQLPLARPTLNSHAGTPQPKESSSMQLNSKSPSPSRQVNSKNAQQNSRNGSHTVKAAGEATASNRHSIANKTQLNASDAYEGAMYRTQFDNDTPKYRPSAYMSPSKPKAPSPNQPELGNCDIYLPSIPNASRQMPQQLYNPRQQQQHQFRGSSPMPSHKVSSDVGAVEADNGADNFRRIMDDHFEHYKRPASREQSVDKVNMPNTLAEAKFINLNRRQSRQSSRSRSPLRNISLSRTDVRTDITTELQINGEPPDLFAEESGNGQHRGPSQVVENIGSIPKRTESMYFKPFLETGANGKESQATQRKKSLPDVQDLVVVTNSQGSKQMTREEISVLSSSRRDTVRRQFQEVERYKNNPLLYILNPSVKGWFYRQRLALFIMFLNISLAVMFFNLLT